MLRFEDLEAVLEATDTESLRDLLNVVCEMSRVHGVEACYHLDPNAVDDGRLSEIKEAPGGGRGRERHHRRRSRRHGGEGRRETLCAS